MNGKIYTVLVLMLFVSLWSAANYFTVSSQTANTLSEGFDAGGTWTLDDALIGNLSGDAKTGAYSARVRNVGKVR